MQLATFYLQDRIFGLSVSDVQEISKPMGISDVPLAPQFVHGLINLRGQIATAISLRSLLGLEASNPHDGYNVVCQVEGVLVALVVDRVGDVMSFEESELGRVPETVSGPIKKLLSGVVKMEGQILSVLDMTALENEIQAFQFEMKRSS